MRGSKPGERVSSATSETLQSPTTRRATVTLVDARSGSGPVTKAATTRGVVTQFVIATVVVVLVLLAASAWANRRAARQESFADARRVTALLATAVVQPHVSDRLLSGDPEARAVLDGVVKDRVLGSSLVRVKLWTAEGRIVYSDEPRLVGETFSLDPEDLETLRNWQTEADVSDLSRPENRFERQYGSLLEVYRPVETPQGTPLLLETYTRFNSVNARAGDVWLRFAPITLVALVLLGLVQMPLARRMVRQLRDVQRVREQLLQRAADVSGEERRRIAGALHDGVVQDLAGASFVVTGARDRIERGDAAGAVPALDGAAEAIRESIAGLRSMLAEIYPPSLRSAGLAAALRDVTAPLGARGIEVDVRVAAGLDLPADVEAVLFRVAQEALRNVTKHADASRVQVRVERPDRAVRLEVTDDGVGFDPGAASEAGHLGLHVLTDAVRAAGGALDVTSAADAGTTVRVEVPLP